MSGIIPYKYIFGIGQLDDTACNVCINKITN